MSLEIITNRNWRDFLYGHELTAKERETFDWMTPEEIDCGSFARYKGFVYSTQDFMRLQDGGEFSELGWQGASADGFFSGVLIKMSDDGEQYQIGTYLERG